MCCSSCKPCNFSVFFLIIQISRKRQTLPHQSIFNKSAYKHITEVVNITLHFNKSSINLKEHYMV